MNFWIFSQDEGYDVQTLGTTRDIPTLCDIVSILCIASSFPTPGFGKMSTYHANNEYCLLSDFTKGKDFSKGTKRSNRLSL